jgi:recombinational DNA repair protein RecR
MSTKLCLEIVNFVKYDRVKAILLGWKITYLYFPHLLTIWSKLGMRALRLHILSLCKFHENQCRRAVVFLWTWMNFIHLCKLKPHILKECLCEVCTMSQRTHLSLVLYTKVTSFCKHSLTSDINTLYYNFLWKNV